MFKNQTDINIDEKLKANQITLWDGIKKMPADLLGIIADNHKLNEISYCAEIASATSDEELYIGSNLFIQAHELGHMQKFITDKKVFEENKKLIKTYKEEFKAFEKQYPNSYQDGVKYFSKTGGSSDDGLDEFVAEVSALMTCCSMEEWNLVSERSQILVRHFPKTIAMIGNLLKEEYLK